MNKKLITILAMTTVLTVSVVCDKNNIIRAYAGGVIEEMENNNSNGNNLDNGGEEKPEIQKPPSNNIQSKKVIIKSVSIDKETIEPGQDFSITYKIENISGKKIYDLSLKIVGIEGKGILEGFTPKETTNEIYVGYIPVKGTKEVTIKLTSDPNIKTGVYNFITSVMFNEYGQEQEEISKISGIVLKSIPKLELTDIQCTESNGKSNIVGNVGNTGKSKIKNVNIKAKINEKELNYTIGTIDSESEETFELFLDEVENDTVAEIEATYEDESGVSYSTKGSCSVRRLVNDANQMNEVSDDKKNDGGLWNFIKNMFRFGV